MPSDVQIGTHQATTRLDRRELVRQLVSHLGPALVAALAGVRDTKQPYKWMKPDGPEPRDDAYAKLQAAHRVWGMISAAESDSVARAWFIGANPRLDEASPVMSLRSGNLPEVLAAANAFIVGVDD